MTQRGSLVTVLGSMRNSWCQCQCDPVDINVGKLRVSGGQWGSVGVIGTQSLSLIGGHWSLLGGVILAQWCLLGVSWSRWGLVGVLGRQWGSVEPQW